MTIPSAPIRTGRRTLLRQFATASAALGVILTAAAFPASAAPSSTAPPSNSSGTSVPPPTTSTNSGRDGFTLFFEVPSTAVQGTTITVRGRGWPCGKVTVAPGWTTSTTTVAFPSYVFDASVTVPANTTPGASTITATCTENTSNTSTRPITVLVARTPTTVPIVTTDTGEANPIPPTAAAEGPEPTSGTGFSAPLAVTAALILAAVAGTVVLLGRRKPATQTPAPGSDHIPAPQGRRTTESAHAGSSAAGPRHPGRAPDVRVRAHPDPNPRLHIRTLRLPDVQIRVHRTDPTTTVREVRR